MLSQTPTEPHINQYTMQPAERMDFQNHRDQDMKSNES